MFVTIVYDFSEIFKRFRPAWGFSGQIGPTPRAGAYILREKAGWDRRRACRLNRARFTGRARPARRIQIPHVKRPHPALKKSPLHSRAGEQNAACPRRGRPHPRCKRPPSCQCTSSLLPLSQAPLLPLHEPPLAIVTSPPLAFVGSPPLAIVGSPPLASVGSPPLAIVTCHVGLSNILDREF